MIAIPTHPDYAAHLQATRPRLVMVVEPAVTFDQERGLWLYHIEPDALITWGASEQPFASGHSPSFSPFGPPGSEVLLYEEAPTGCDHKFIGTPNCVRCGWKPAMRGPMHLTIARSELRHVDSITEEEARLMGFTWHSRPGWAARPIDNLRYFLDEHHPGALWLWLGEEERDG